MADQVQVVDKVSEKDRVRLLLGLVSGAGTDIFSPK